MLAVGALSVLGCGTTEPEPDAAPSVLVFSRTEGFRHPSIEPGIEAIERLANNVGAEVYATEDPLYFTSERLETHDVVVFLSTTGDVLNAAQEEAFTEFIRAGGGFVGVHSATDTEDAWPWYGGLVGARFERHPAGPNVRRGTLTVAGPSHPATETLPSPWVRDDEWYDFQDMAPGLTTLLEIDETSYKTPAENPSPTPRPISWSQEFEGGRVFYTALGHTVESFAEPLFLEHLQGGLAWVLER